MYLSIAAFRSHEGLVYSTTGYYMHNQKVTDDICLSQKSCYFLVSRLQEVTVLALRLWILRCVTRFEM